MGGLAPLVREEPCHIEYVLRPTQRAIFFAHTAQNSKGKAINTIYCTIFMDDIGNSFVQEQLTSNVFAQGL